MRQINKTKFKGLSRERTTIYNINLSSNCTSRNIIRDITLIFNIHGKEARQKNMVGINVTKGQDTSKILFFMYDIIFISLTHTLDSAVQNDIIHYKQMSVV